MKRPMLRDLILKKYQLGGNYQGVVDYAEPIGDPNAVKKAALDGGLSQAAGAIPVWGQVAQAGMALSNAIEGDGTNTGRSVAAGILNPVKGITNAISSGNWEEAIPIIGGAFSAKRRRKEEAKADTIKDSQQQGRMLNVSSQRLANYDQFGNQTAALGGKLNRLASDIYEVEGNKHSEGGVKLNSTTEVEGDETISGDYVFSDALGFADKHKSLAKQLGKIEKKPLTRATRVSVEILRKKEEALKQEQEAVRAQLGLGEEAQFLGAKFGGRLKKYQLGGVTDPDYVPPASTEAEYKKYMDNTYNNRQIAVQKDWTFSKNMTPEERADLYTIKEYNRDNYNKWQKAWDSGQDVTLDQFGISQEEASEFGKNPYLKSFKQYYGNAQNKAGVSVQDMMVSPTFYDRNPYIPPVEEPVVTQTPAKAMSPIAQTVIQKTNKPTSYKGQGIKFKTRPENTRIGYNNKGKMGFRLVR